MDLLDANNLNLLATVVETTVVYVVTGAAALYVVHTLARAFRPPQSSAQEATTSDCSSEEVPRSVESPCGACRGCGSRP